MLCRRSRLIRSRPTVCHLYAEPSSCTPNPSAVRRTLQMTPKPPTSPPHQLKWTIWDLDRARFRPDSPGFVLFRLPGSCYASELQLYERPRFHGSYGLQLSFFPCRWPKRTSFFFFLVGPDYAYLCHWARGYRGLQLQILLWEGFGLRRSVRCRSPTLSHPG